ncbi:glycoside hydrolase family 2 TIM barrel-domain containing protein [Flavobacterium sp.]|uniref:glycoside hydrolase family 2 TIM barrel-domain containing protein n=1 Tax=Flavobacterium sp. TaxID=239 RepID=UPI00286E2A03|nr:glycoside hydrolase family 2 TIM barrel-domain containing protein [Flavobacterium sp.]
MKKIFFLLTFWFCSSAIYSQSDKVIIDKSDSGFKLKVNGNDFMINGMNWDYCPIGNNFSYSLWKQPDNIIKEALEDEMSLLKNMGVNTIRVYSDIPKKWIEYIYANYGIYTMLNHTFGRYGLTLKGTWVANTEYSDDATREVLLNEVTQMIKDYKDTKGLLLFLLGNENNYGLFWDGAATENIPVEDRVSTKRARYMYKLFNEAVVAMKAIDTSHPIAICNGDLLFLDIIAEECKDIDILGSNVYRGVSFGDFFEKVKKETGKPVLFTEFGSDAFNVISNEEDQKSQSYYLKNNWREIYENAAGLGKAGNSLGGFTFQFSDGWWKTGQTVNLDVHDNAASWSNGGYQKDYEEGENNMNEEWFGICAKGPSNSKGLYQLYPRSAYYILKEAHQLNPYASETTLSSIKNHFDRIQQMDATLKARGDKAALDSKKGDKIRFSRLSAEFTTFNTGGSLITTPKKEVVNNTTYPNQLGFDHMQSYFIGVEGNPSANSSINVEFNILGNVAKNPIDQIFYENRGLPIAVNSNNGNLTLDSNNRVQVYKASYKWNHKLFDLNGFYRTGHYHWGYEGDFFGLYPEANYGPQIDVYNGAAPFGFEVEGKKLFKGLKLAFGPQLWWGANPALLLKYSKKIGKFDLTGIFHEDIAQQSLTQSSFAIPQPKTRRLTLHMNRKIGNFGIDLGGIWGGQPLNGRDYQVSRGEEGNYKVYQNQIESKDNWGGKIKFTYLGGTFNWYGQSAIMGLVANGGADYTKTFTGWHLKDSGSGNQYNFLSGFTYTVGKLQIAPNFLWQKPIEGPMTTNVPAPGRPRNILDDPFVVRGNREQVAGELLLTYDPTPGTWMYDWDNDRTEDSKFSLSAGIVYRRLPTTQDAAIGIFPNGRTTFAFPGAAPAKNLYEINTRIVSKFNRDFSFIVNMYGGEGQANGSDGRTINRIGIDMRMIYNKIKLSTFFKINDWGPYDYHRDFNLTFPVQLMADISTQIGKPDWFILPNTRIGVRGAWRSLDKYSPRYNPTQMLDGTGNFVPNPNAIGFSNGQEWEIRTYVLINIGN